MSDFGIKETKEAATFMVEFVAALRNSLEDGKIRFTDLGYFFGAMKDLPAAIGGVAEVPSEVRDLDAAEVDELANHVADKLRATGIIGSNEEVLAFTEKLVSAISSLFGLVKAAQCLVEGDE